jgi:hypothetical protein
MRVIARKLQIACKSASAGRKYDKQGRGGGAIARAETRPSEARAAAAKPEPALPSTGIFENPAAVCQSYDPGTSRA